MTQKSPEGLNFKPFRFYRQFFGARKVQVSEGTHMFRLGKKCKQCGKSIIHRDAISVCQCYCFAHKECLKYQLKQARVAECSVVECRDCKGKVDVRVDSDYFLKLNFTVGDLIVLFICAALCAASMIYLVNFKNVQREEIRQEEIRTHHKKSMPFMSMEQMIPVSVLFVSGTVFWFCLIGMILNKKAVIKDIVGTNTEIKVSAFEEIEIKIREESQQCIATRKDEIDL